MEIHYTDSIFAVQSDGNALLMLTIQKNQKRLYDDIKAFENDILKVMTIEYFKEKRSKDANSGFWLMCDRVAKKVGNTKDNIYVEMVKKYGVFDDLIMAAEVFPIYKKRRITFPHRCFAVNIQSVGKGVDFYVISIKT